METNRNTENIVECIGRIYRIQMSGGLVIELESRKPLSPTLDKQLIEEDPEIKDFFETHTILNVRRIVRPPPGQRTTDLGASKLLIKNGRLSQRQRLNQLLKMKGEFTREDYIKYLYDQFQYKLNRWTSFDDIQNALKINKLQIIKERKGKSSRIYKVVDTEEIDDSLYQKLLEDRKLKISTLA